MNEVLGKVSTELKSIGLVLAISFMLFLKKKEIIDIDTNTLIQIGSIMLGGNYIVGSARANAISKLQTSSINEVSPQSIHQDIIKEIKKS